MLGLVSDIGIDLGTASIIVFVKGKGIVLREPSVVAMDRDTRKILAIGTEARRMIGRTPGNIVAIRPLREGVIADYEITEAMLKHFLAQVCGRRALVRPRIMVCVPSGVTSFEKKAVLEAAQQAGARKAFVIEEPLAAALGACLDIFKPSASMVVDIGGGTTDIAILSLGGIVLSESLRIGGDKMDEAISRYMKREHNLAIGERTAEEIKISVGTAFPGSREVSTEVRGRDLVTGMPKTVSVTSSEVAKAISECLTAILDGVHRVLEKTPPEMSADIVDKGIVLTGGGALLDGLDKLLIKVTGVPVHIADDPISCVAMGTGKALEYAEVSQDHLKVLDRIL